jgi:hypothetical protein
MLRLTAAFIAALHQPGPLIFLLFLKKVMSQLFPPFDSRVLLAKIESWAIPSACQARVHGDANRSGAK